MRILLGCILLVASVGFGYVALRRTPGRLLGLAERAAAILSVILGMAVLANPANWFGRATGGDTNQTATVNNGGSGPAVIQQVGTGTAIAGDLSTTAENRYRAALEVVAGDYPKVLGTRVSQLLAVESRPPEVFWDTRRPNETAAAYQERARAEFDRYVSDIDSAAVGLYPVDSSAYTVNQRDLGHDASVVTIVSSAYGYLDSANQTWIDPVGLIPGLHQLALSGNLDDSERVEQARALWTDKSLTARIALVQSLVEALRVPGLEGSSLLAAEAGRLGITLDPAAESDWRSVLLTEAAELSRKRAANLASRPTPISGATDQQPVTAQDHFVAAANDYLAADGRGAVGHFQAAIDSGELSGDLQAYAEASMAKLTDPALFGDAMGLFLLRVDDGGRFQAAGLQPHDTIIAIDGAAADEIPQLTMAMLQPTGLVATVVRAGTTMTIRVGGTGAGGAAVSQLVVLAGQQI